MTSNLWYIHSGQSQVYNDTRRFRVSCSGRRFGKTSLMLLELLKASLTFEGKPSRTSPETVIAVMPTFTQAKEVIWKPLISLCESEGVQGAIESINRSDYTINFHGKPRIKVAGANDNNGDRLRGLRVYFAGIDEVQDVKPQVFWDVIRPAMSDTVGSRALFTGTPKGKLNWLYQLSRLQETDKDWGFHNLPTWLNPTIPREEIEQARLTLPPRLFAQEYEASFTDFPGKWYSELDSNNKHFGDLPQFDLVVMGIDWGDLHPALVVIGRGVDRCWYFVEAWSPGGTREAQPIPDPILHSQVRRLVKKWQVNRIYCDPSRPSAILAIRALGDEIGYRSAAEGYNRIAEGIGQIHGLISENRLLFSGGLSDKIPDAIDGDLAYELFQAYHRESDKNGQFTEVPADGYESHVNDATRYALATKMTKR
jgi:Terminase large subunit, T4likevirus-type, N-terminal